MTERNNRRSSNWRISGDNNDSSKGEKSDSRGSSSDKKYSKDRKSNSGDRRNSEEKKGYKGSEGKPRERRDFSEKRSSDERGSGEKRSDSRFSKDNRNRSSDERGSGEKRNNRDSGERRSDSRFSKDNRSRSSDERGSGEKRNNRDSEGRSDSRFSKDNRNRSSDERGSEKRSDSRFSKDNRNRSDGKSGERRSDSRFSKDNRNRSDSRNRSDGRDGEVDKKFKPFKPFRSRGKSYNSVKVEDDGKVRLNKFISNSGVCSRREADEFITMGLVSVNGVYITELGARVDPTDDIKLNGKKLQGEKKVYVLLNKPKGYVTSVRDPFHDKTVMLLVKKACKERIFPVGRLDKDTTGVLLFTNDGELAGKLTHPSYNKKKVYHVFLDENMSSEDMSALTDGINLRDGFIKADSINYVGSKKNEIGLEIHSGKNRIVRRMFAHLGYKVTKLDRVYFAGLTKKNLQRGEWRLLRDQEVEVLKMGSYE